MTSPPPLKFLHGETSLIGLKLEMFRKLDTSQLTDSLTPGQPGSLKVRLDGTIMDGHHRIAVLRERGVDVDSLPREVIAKD
jgi:hypothetical protein